MSIISPILVGDVDGMPIRMFASPRWLANGQRDMPWHSTEDLRAALGLPDELSTLFRRGAQRDLAASVRTVATPDGITTIGPNAMAEGLIEALRFRPMQVSPDRRKVVRARYRESLTAALKAMLGPMPEGAKLAFALEALDG